MFFPSLPGRRKYDLPLSGSGNLYCRQLNRPAGWKDCKKIQLSDQFRKVYGSLADKLLVCSALICLIELGQLPAWMVIIIISREFIISGFRLIASDNGIVIAASYWGKFKTTFQMIAVILLIVNIPALSVIADICVWIALALTIISLVDYVKKNHKILTEGSK